MTSISSVDTITPHSVSSRSPSPVATEEDLSKAHAWTERDEREAPELLGKGKGKRVDRGEDSSQEALDQADAAYPPVNDDEAETRRVEENLRRWEIAERQRRKAARESTTSSTTPSLIDRASLLWPGRKSRHSAHAQAGLGNHTALKSRESLDGVSLEDLASPAPSSPSHSVSDETRPENPFANPTDPISPFADPRSIMARSPSLQSSLGPSTTVPTPSGPLSIPPPQPLNLPPPRTPPPLPSAQQLRATASPSLTPPPHNPVPEATETRWWHEWLCGCGEGPDRGGDHQAGRTNPFE